MAPEDDAGREAGRLRRYLESQGNRFEYRRTIGNGSFGVACLIRHNRSDGTRRDIVVKRALKEADQRNLEKEIDLAKRLGGGLHFAMPIHIVDNPLERMSGPTMTMEYLHNGTLGDFITRCARLDYPLPNRVLWRLFGCLLRFVAGLAFPIRWKEGREQKLERFSKNIDAMAGSNLCHGDIHAWNILIGDFDPDDHTRVPILKLVDFGQAYEHPGTGRGYNDAIASNVMGIGEIMLSLIQSKPWTAMTIDANNQVVPTDEPAPVRLTPDFGNAYAGGVYVVSYAARTIYHSDGRWRNRNVDPDLLLLAARCLAKGPWDRPGLNALAEIGMHGMGRDANYYRRMPYADNEHMEFIDMFVRDVMVRPPPAVPVPLPPVPLPPVPLPPVPLPPAPIPPPPPPANGLRLAMRRAATEAKEHRRHGERRRRESSPHGERRHRDGSPHRHHHRRHRR